MLFRVLYSSVFIYFTFLSASSDIVPVVRHLFTFTAWDNLAFRKPPLLVAGHKKGRARAGISSCIWMPRQRRFWPETWCLAVPFLWTRYLRNAGRDFGTSSRFVLIPALINCIHLSPHSFFPRAPVPPSEDLQSETMRGERKPGKKRKMKTSFHLERCLTRRAFVLMAPADYSWISCQLSLIRHS